MDEKEAIEETIKKLHESYQFHLGLAEFHENRAIDETCNAEEREFHLQKMKYNDTLCESISNQIKAIYTKKQNKNKTMEEKIKEVQEYFINKILNGEFEVNIEKSDEYALVIEIDEKYEFSIWAENDINSRQQYTTSKYPNFMQLGEFSDELKEVTDKHVVEYRSNHLNRLKEKEIRELELRLKKLRSDYQQD
ncbi:hypothetical protein EZS27_004062 [termite gut metagenome]|uniref:Uncharacterized protein n=1 Tax=termite gut metagenome TaxID=433724 RepID=A0A5J4SRL3_9ZZZZ